MKKIVLNISEHIFEKLRFEALFEEKSIQTLILERLFTKPFHEEVEKAFDEFMVSELDKIIKE